MSAEATFRALLVERPEDLEARLVYADWLEGEGDPQRANVLRALVRLARLTSSPGTLLRRAGELRALAKGLDAEWIASVSYPSLVGTCWGALDEDGRSYLFGFLAGGKLAFKREDGTTPGTWSQVGTAVELTINQYSPHAGVFVGKFMRGTAYNQTGLTWSWGAIRQPDPAVLDAAGMPELEDVPVDSPFVQGPTPASSRRTSRPRTRRSDRSRPTPRR
ncbi:MAG TPA: TIGR02996 domain-containing protein [Kofleriaceae bacterium]